MALPFTLANERVTHENGLVLDNGTAELEWLPVRPGTLRGVIEAGPVYQHGSETFVYAHRLFVCDDANGNLIVEGKEAGSIDYLTGHMAFGAQFRHAEYLLDYYFDSGNHQWGFTLKLVSTPVRAEIGTVRSS